MPLSPDNAVRFPRTGRVIRQGIDEGLHHGMQVYVSLDGRPVADFAMGENVPGVPLSADALMPWLSSGKPLTAAAVMRLVEVGTLDLDRPVREIVPEFVGGGKDDVTLRRILTHAVGLRPVQTGWPEKSWEEILQKVYGTAVRPGWEPGRHAAYDPQRTWFVLGEMLQRIHARPIDQIMRTEMLDPLGMIDSHLAIPDDRFEELAPRLGVMHARPGTELIPTPAHERPTVTRPSPGSSLRGPARDLGRFYEMLLRRGTLPNGTPWLSERTVRAMTERQRIGLFDDTFQHQVDFGLGLIVNSNRYGRDTVPYGFGPHAGEEAFGHGGSQSSIGFADPEHRLVVVAVANGSPGEQLHNQRHRSVAAAVYEDLGLARE